MLFSGEKPPDPKLFLPCEMRAGNISELECAGDFSPGNTSEVESTSDIIHGSTSEPESTGDFSAGNNSETELIWINCNPASKISSSLRLTAHSLV
ncbi:MAG: hypothetical protein GX267_09980 [Fibrobacter sp.]|nr:hypothetical protein [Fibrobacter sp.]